MAKELQATQVRKSIRTFKDYSGDLLASDSSTFADRVQVLMHFCRTDSVFSAIHRQLVDNPNVDGSDWLQKHANPYAARLNGLIFPVDADERISLMYQLLAAAEENPDVLISRLPFWYQRTDRSVTGYIHAFAEGVMAPLFRELDYRLEEIETKLPVDDTQTLDYRILQVITNSGSFTQQIAQGRAINQNVGVNNEALQNLFSQLRAKMDESPTLSASQRSEAKKLIEAAEDEVKSSAPRKSVVKRLLSGLPTAIDAAKLVLQIISMCDPNQNLPAAASMN
jgi:hypothetical protein